jgi:hypothetical protein
MLHATTDTGTRKLAGIHAGQVLHERIGQLQWQGSRVDAVTFLTDITGDPLEQDVCGIIEVIPFYAEPLRCDHDSAAH